MSFPKEQKVDFQSFQNVINNQLSSTSENRHGICPSTEQLLWESPISTQDDVDKAVSAAKAAYPAWRKLSWDERASYLVKFADATEAHKQEFIDLLGREAGKPPQAGGFELMLVMEHVRETPKLRIKEDKPEDNEDRTAVIRYVPLGVGVGIVPWNFPMLLGTGKAYPAMLAGNTFIWKPSPYTPYSALKLAEIGAKVLPPGVFQALSGGDDLGPMLTAHPGVAKVIFTGSTETGKKIMAACAATLKRVTPAASAATSEKGYFIPSVLIDSPPENSEIVQAEPFGPIVPVMKWQSEGDVISRVNSSDYGLGASVWSKDVTRARRMAEQLEAGSVWVNTHFEVAPNVPFGGHKHSGIGMDWGEVGLKGWCNPQAYWVKHSG
ncbi:hypothetical protein H9Q72_003575 [Fusarium xylarioides]|uniref:Putative aldehyde dehydrogenase FUS7 n=1 Tax=Fusarium xylarioides TaxID=221167 RepID=A0A9P7HYS7_9HYPO|nr:hypothetical protein H9Q72_003575 [Fusarium xylarioides]